MCSVNGRIANVLSSGLMGLVQCALGMGLANVHWELDYPMCPGNGTSQCAQ